RTKPRQAEPSAPSLSEQLAAMRGIRAAVKSGHAAKARARIATYRQDLEGGAFTAEVDALEVELSCRTHDVGARAQLRVFVEQHRGSALVERLRVLCSSKIGPQKPRASGTQGP
ncbi:MAG: hypothetical protein KUG77_09970, partial [Nannocystaceae bacterium]|nr:hypothetical protein [Nannocystaceae bacterium]